MTLVFNKIHRWLNCVILKVNDPWGMGGYPPTVSGTEQGNQGQYT